MDDGWIVVRNWQQFQHYGKRRNPPWIKLHTELNSNDEWLALSVGARGVLTTIWVEFARSSGQVRVENVQRLGGSSVRERHWKALIDAGFIGIVASKPARTTLAPRARARGEVLRTSPREGGAPPTASGGPPPIEERRRRALNWIRNGLAAEVPLEQLDYVLADEFKIDDPEILRDLVAQATELRT